MSDPATPLRLEPVGRVGSLEVVRQPAPEGAPTFAATYLTPAGWGFDPKGREGTARLVNQLAVSAAGPWGRIELARRLDRAGGSLQVDTSPEAAEISVWGPRDAWEPLLEILAASVRRPRFDPDDLARAIRQLRERQLRERNHPGSRAHAELLRAVFPEAHPYRSSGLGDGRSASRISRAGLVEFHRERYGAAGAQLVVTAAAGGTAVERAIRKHFSGMSETSRAPLRLPAIPRAAPRRVEIDLPGHSQVEVRVAGPSVPQSAPEYAAGYLGNQVLGGRPLISRLFQNVREQSGLAYGASSHLETLRRGGWWVAGAGTGADRWTKVVPLVEGEVARLREESVPPDELGTVRESAIGEIPLGLESTAEAHQLAVDVVYHGMPPDFWLTWPGRLRAIRSDDVRRAAGTVFDPNHSATVVVGPLSGGPSRAR